MLSLLSACSWPRLAGWTLLQESAGDSGVARPGCLLLLPPLLPPLLRAMPSRTGRLPHAPHVHLVEVVGLEAPIPCISERDPGHEDDAVCLRGRARRALRSRRLYAGGQP